MDIIRKLGVIWLVGILLVGFGIGVVVFTREHRPAPPPEPVKIFYEVQPGDCLWKIAEAMMGDKDLWPLIWEANGTYGKDGTIINSPDLIYPGDKLLIPDHSDEDATWAKAYSKWRRSWWKPSMFPAG